MLLLYLIAAASILCGGGQTSPDERPSRYILYDVNPGEGFNLRRDVYMRLAVF